MRSSWGLSPRVRGNPPTYPPFHLSLRSIPACAGEPHKARHKQRAIQVYPRVCGGTSRCVRPEGLGHGLSPRVRGNRLHQKLHVAELGSIPACAGEPRINCAPFFLSRVYPRVCGGTRRRARSRMSGRGLSPRVRGNRARKPARSGSSRSIPACAGEPQSCPDVGGRYLVYPRVCGGTSRTRRLT